MRLLVVGAGATGGYFGGRLAQAGRDVTFLVRPQRAALIAAQGLQIISPHGDVTLQPQLAVTGSIAAPYDAVLLAVKAYSLEAALEDFAPAVGPDTMIIPVLNGMRHMDVLTARFGAQAVVGGVCKVAATIDGEGRILQLAGFQELIYGERDGTASSRMQALDTFMKNAGFTALLSPDVEREMWEKWILLASMGGVTCLMRGTIGDIVAAPGGLDFTHRFINEVVTVASHVGKAPSPGFLKAATAMLTEKGSPQASSMYRDLQNGAPIEADQIIGDLLARAQSTGIATPLLAAAYASLAIYQSRQKAA